MDNINIPFFGDIPKEGKGHVKHIDFETHTTKDNKVVSIMKGGDGLFYVTLPNARAFYQLLPAKIKAPIKAVLMDMDGSSTDTEKLVLEAIRKMMSEVLNKDFQFKKEDMQHVMGDATSTHIQYLIQEYGLDKKRAREYEDIYYEHYHKTLYDVRDGKAKGLIEPRPGLKQFLLHLKEHGIQVGLVTSSLQEELEIVMDEVFRVMGMKEDFRDFYDGIISAGIQGKKGRIGTLGELCLKPHPWLYKEMGQRIIGIPLEQRNQCVVIEDSTAGIAAGRLAGYPVIWVPHGDSKSHDNSLATHLAPDGLPQILEKKFFIKP